MQGVVRRSSSRSLFMAVVAAAGIVGILILGPFLFPLLALAETNLLDAVVLLDRRLLGGPQRGRKLGRLGRLKLELLGLQHGSEGVLWRR